MAEITKVLEMQELYKLIPETKKLEHTEFTNLKDLLVKLIFAIELSGKWEFIQYITNKPSLFIIREKSKQSDSGFQTIDCAKSTLINKDIRISDYNVKGIEIETMDSLFPTTTKKLPWEK